MISNSLEKDILSSVIFNPKKKVKPIIKWTGGKFNEYKAFEAFIPPFSKYYEPFVGGGGVFFASASKLLQQSVSTYINDISADLICFYQMVGSQMFINELIKRNDIWESSDLFSKKVKPVLFELYLKFKQEGADSLQINSEIERIIESCFAKKLLSKFDIIDIGVLKNQIIDNLKSKFMRVDKIENSERDNFNEEEIKIHIETAIRSGYYMYFRHLMNKYKTKNEVLTEEQRIANWYVVRELSFAGMFRFDKGGNFNIPYGGIAYNKKNLRQKIDKIANPVVCALFTKTEIYNDDFEVFLNRFNFTKTDFIFLDPPYDSEFSEYDNNAFNKTDHVRLANFLYNCQANWMLVIKNTEFIHHLYKREGIFLSYFDKKYMHNIRGRNDRETEHLIVTNYKTGGDSSEI